MHISKNVSIISCNIFKKDKSGHFVLDFFGSNPSKLDQTWSNWISKQSKNVTINNCHTYKKVKNGRFISVQNRSNLIKLDWLQNWVWLGGSFAVWLCALTQCILVKPIYSCSLERKKDCKHFVSYKYWIKKNLICRILLLVHSGQKCLGW